MTSIREQPTQLLPALFRHVDEDQRLQVLHLGPACQDTLDFFSSYRCRLQIIDLFAELPVPAEEDTQSGLQDYFRDLLQLNPDTRFDVCLFWDLFNYLPAAALQAFMQVLAPHLADTCLGHAFSVHNPRTEELPLLFGIRDSDCLGVRRRAAPVPGYAPHSQNRLKELLHCFAMERSVLLADRRLELLLRARAAEPARH
ncbi:MAG: hypothetical protein CME59_05910 [Halioglobus sp.]|nr:hypothetical protein [Halioglobus sp.]